MRRPVMLLALSALLLLPALSVTRAYALEQTSLRGRYQVELEPEAWPLTPGVIETFRLRLRRIDGQPTSLAALAVDGGMPAHGHGLATRPSVAPAAGDTALRVDGLRFQMAGHWELRVLLVDAQGSDACVFGFEVVSATAMREGIAGFTAAELATLRSLSLASLPPTPPDPSNRAADDARAVVLGQRLFFDPRLSRGGELSCASCHQPQRHFSDGRTTGRGESVLGRNTPSLVGAAFSRFLHWDGRSDSLWSQALNPIESEAEMHGDRVSALRLLARVPGYRRGYETLFGALPDLKDLPARAGPRGDATAQAAWARIAPSRQDAISRAFANLGKLLAAYERQLRPAKSAFDRYVEALEQGDEELADKTLDKRAVAGLRLFISEQTQCLRCHNGPMLSNGGFHNVATESSAADGPPDFGRSLGIQALLSSEFGCASAHNDAPNAGCPELAHLDRHDENAGLLGAFKVPSLRNVSSTGPYMHDGRFASLREVLEHYRSPRAPSLAMEFRPLFDLSAGHLEALAAFLEALKAGVVAPPELLRAPPP